MKSKNWGAQYSVLTLQIRKPVKSLKREKVVAEWEYLGVMALGFFLPADVKLVCLAQEGLLGRDWFW